MISNNEITNVLKCNVKHLLQQYKKVQGHLKKESLKKDNSIVSTV